MKTQGGIVLAATVIMLGSALIANRPWASSAVNWANSVPQSMAESLKTGKLVAIEFNSANCDPCRDMANQVYTDPAVGKEMRRFIPVEVSIDHAPGMAMMKKYGLPGVPSIIFLNGNGDEMGRIVGAMPKAEFLSALQTLHPRKVQYGNKLQQMSQSLMP